jgi:hypothetical protein
MITVHVSAESAVLLARRAVAGLWSETPWWPCPRVSKDHSEFVAEEHEIDYRIMCNSTNSECISTFL